MHGRRNPFVAREGLPFLAGLLALAVLLYFYVDPWYALAPLPVFILMYLIFRDPLRKGPSVALGVFSPVDGKVTEVGRLDSGELGAPVLRVKIRVNSFGTYTARAPVEGTIKDAGTTALWLQTDEKQDVTLVFSGYRFGLAPWSLSRYGERLGQGQRCAYLRLTRYAEVQMPEDSKILVEVGQAVSAGTDAIATVISIR